MHSIRATLLSIDEFAEIMGLNPYYLAQIGDNVPLRRQRIREAKCDDVTFEHEWQDEKLSRYEIARAIEEAELKFATEVGYWPAPKFITDEAITYPQPAADHLYRQLDHRRHYPKVRAEGVRLAYGYVRAFGVENLETISDSATVVLSDANGDGVTDTFTCTIAMPIPLGWHESEICVFITDGDRFNWPLSEWEVRPITVRFDSVAEELIITGASYLIVDPAHVVPTAPERLDADDVFTYVPNLLVMRRTVNNENQGLARVGRGCTPSEIELCMGNIDTKIGLVTVVPDRANHPHISCRGEMDVEWANVNYLAGYPRQANGKMDKYHAQIISWLAAAYLQCLPCGCACSSNDKLLSHFAEIETIQGARGNFPILTTRQIENPFGPQRGAIKAWNNARQLAIK